MLEIGQTISKSVYVGGNDDELAEAAVVEYINIRHGWYMVRFKRTGLRQCYKIGT